jgi:hypothetical protein
VEIRLGAFAATALGIAALAMGCGDSGDDGTATAAPLTKAEFIRQADAICSKGGKESEAELAKFVKEQALPKGATPTAKQIAEAGSKILAPGLREQSDELHALGPPAEGADQIDEFLAGIDAAIGQLEENPAEAKSTAKLFADTDKIAQEYGFKVCGNR